MLFLNFRNTAYDSQLLDLVLTYRKLYLIIMKVA